MGEYLLIVTVKDAAGGVGSLSSSCNVTVEIAGAPSYYCSSGCGTTGEVGEVSQTYSECVASCFLCRWFIGSIVGSGSGTVTYRACVPGNNSQGPIVTHTYGGTGNPYLFNICAQRIISSTGPATFTITEGTYCS
jgi:hypothetical protein